MCHNCGKEGHVKPMCTEELRTCRGCRNKGHMLKFCRSSNKGIMSHQASAVAPYGQGQRPPDSYQKPGGSQPTVQDKEKPVRNEPSKEGRRLYTLHGVEMTSKKVPE